MSRVDIQGGYQSKRREVFYTPPSLELKYGERFIESLRSDESLNALLVSPAGESFVAIALAVVGDGDDPQAIYMAMTPAFAREFAEQILLHAHKAERGQTQ